MDTMRSQEDVADSDAYDSGAIEAPPVISAQERRMHVRAYNYWVSLLGNRSLPSIEDLNPEEMEDFAANSVLLDFSMGLENPAIIYLGSALREECGITGAIERADQVPARSLLSRLTDHYLQIIANAAPVGFEAEFTNQRSAEIMYRGILMPFSSDDETIDFIYGVISWKEVAGQSLTEGLDEEVRAALSTAPARYSTAPIWADGPSATADYDDDDEGEGPAETSTLGSVDFGFDELPSTANVPAAQDDDIEEKDELDLSAFFEEEEGEAPLELSEVAPEEVAGPDDRAEAESDAGAEDAAEYFIAAEWIEEAERREASLRDDAAGPDAGMPPISVEEVEEAPETGEPVVALETEGMAGLAAVLDLARRSAAETRDCDVRGRSALYRALGDAYDFALSASEAPEDYVAMLETAGIAVQDRSPMTAVIKLVFGASYDKTRIAEYALALDYATARALPRGGLAGELEAHEGGLKGLVRDMRAERKTGSSERPARRIERAVKKLGKAQAADIDTLPFDENGLAIVVARREADGSVTLVAGVDLADKAAQKVAITASKSI